MLNIHYSLDDFEGAGENIQAYLEAEDLQSKMKHRTKFFLFNENRRPAFKGTWRKKTSVISARHPLRQDPVSHSKNIYKSNVIKLFYFIEILRL